MSKTILFQGDSITDAGRGREDDLQANLQLGTGYAQMSAAYLLEKHVEQNLQIFNRGISGNRVVDLYARWKKDCLNIRPDVLSILIGVNDTGHERGSQNGVEVERYERVYRELLAWTKETLPNIRFILCEPFILDSSGWEEKWVTDVHKRGAVVKKLATEFNAPLVPFQLMFNEVLGIAQASYWAPDGVHPSLAGHQLMAEKWIEAYETI